MNDGTTMIGTPLVRLFWDARNGRLAAVLYFFFFHKPNACRREACSFSAGFTVSCAPDMHTHTGALFCALLIPGWISRRGKETPDGVLGS